MNPHLARINLYPVKSLDGQSVGEAAILRGFGLAHDREYFLESEDGRVINGKRAGGKLLQIRSSVDFAFGEIELTHGGESQTFSLQRELDAIGAWFSERLGASVRLRHLENASLPDDLNAAGPTIVSTATLREVAGWFAGCDVDEMRRRFRASLEIDGLEAFGEDRLFGAAERPGEFRIGDVHFQGVNPCARCAVPSRDSRTGAIPEPHFAKLFAGRRERTLPAWSDPSRFDHFYRLATNTRIPDSEAGKVLSLGDELILSDS